MAIQRNGDERWSQSLTTDGYSLQSRGTDKWGLVGSQLGKGVDRACDDAGHTLSTQKKSHLSGRVGDGVRSPSLACLASSLDIVRKTWRASETKLDTEDRAQRNCH